MVVVSLRHFCKNGGEKRKKWDDEDGLGGLGRLRWTVGFVVPCLVCLDCSSRLVIGVDQSQRIGARAPRARQVRNSQCTKSQEFN